MFHMLPKPFHETTGRWCCAKAKQRPSISLPVLLLDRIFVSCSARARNCRQLRKAHSYAQVADRSHPLPVGGDESKEGSLNHTGQEFCAPESCNAQGTWRLVGDDWVLLSFMTNFSWQKPTLQVPIERSSVVFDSNTYATWLKHGDWQLCQR